MTTAEASGTRTRIGPVQIAVILLALATASVHLYIFLIEGFLSGLSPEEQQGPIYQVLFAGNFFGYVTLLCALYLPIAPLARFRPVVRTIIIAMAIASIFSYYDVSFIDTIGNVTKIIEVLLIVMLTVDAALSWQGGARGIALAAAQLGIGAVVGYLMFLPLMPLI
jgi:hypothetical protein